MQLSKKFSLISMFTILAAGHASALNLADKPLFLKNSAVPNVLLMLDDSGSMNWEILTQTHFPYCNYLSTTSSYCPAVNSSGLIYKSDGGTAYYMFEGYYEYNADSITFFDNGNDWRILSSDMNVTYFNPDKDYEPWIGLSDASFTSARKHPVSESNGYSSVRDLTGSFYVVADDSAGYTGSSPGVAASNYSSGSNGKVDAWDNHTIYQINGSSISRWEVTYAVSGNRVVRQQNQVQDITSTTEVNAIKQNYANWYQYQRRRSYVTNSAIGSLLNFSPDYRYALGYINQSNMEVNSPSDNDLDTHNKDLLSSLFSSYHGSGGTPLRRGLDLVGTYLSTSGINAPITDSCQQNFAVLFSDGYWNGSFSNTSIGNSDGDSYTSTVADIANYYYSNDLRSDLANGVQSSSSNSVTHQNMSTFTVAFGVEGLLDDSNGDGWPDVNGINLAESSDWGDPFRSRSPAKIDDMWHAAFNSRGLFSSARTPDEMVNALSGALAEVDRRTGSAAAVATNSGSLQGDTHVYQARFDSADWTGDLWALPLDPSGGDVSATATWKAADQLPFSRVIITADRNSNDDLVGRKFRSGSLSSDYQAKLTAGMQALGATGSTDNFTGALVDYLRGANANSFNAYTFRKRNSKLGDLVHSEPVYVGRPNAGITDSSYQAFKTRNANRDAMIYVGANDGMLHGFDAETGEEQLAFVPNTLAGDLYHLADPDYDHRYYVDGAVTSRDVCTNASGTGSCSWKTLLVGALRGGGKGVYALDVTDPNNFSESKANEIFKWEFNSEHDTHGDDMGFSFGDPVIAKMWNDRWAVIVANGYNSANGKAMLFILDAETGETMAVLDTLTGDRSSPNGLSAPTAVDTDADGIVDAIYAGDLQGNLWKFYVSRDWGHGYTIYSDSQGKHIPIPLFSAGEGRPITVAPTVAKHPTMFGQIVYFGTGKYLENIDNMITGQTTQKFYGIWSEYGAVGWSSAQKRDSAVEESSLLAQTIERELAVYPVDSNKDGNSNSGDTSVTLRFTSNNAICWEGCGNGNHKGWVLELSMNGDNRGERQVTRPVLRNGRIIFTTFLPSPSVCDNGGQSWLMELNAVDGRYVYEPPFDINSDSEFDKDDVDLSSWTSANVQALCSGGRCQSPSGILSEGMLQVPTIINCGAGVECKYTSGSGGDVIKIGENPGGTTLGRQSWRELREY